MKTHSKIVGLLLLDVLVGFGYWYVERYIWRWVYSGHYAGLTAVAMLILSFIVWFFSKKKKIIQIVTWPSLAFVAILLLSIVTHFKVLR